MLSKETLNTGVCTTINELIGQINVSPLSVERRKDMIAKLREWDEEIDHVVNTINIKVGDTLFNNIPRAMINKHKKSLIYTILHHTVHEDHELKFQRDPQWFKYILDMMSGKRSNVSMSYATKTRDQMKKINEEAAYFGIEPPSWFNSAIKSIRRRDDIFQRELDNDQIGIEFMERFLPKSIKIRSVPNPDRKENIPYHKDYKKPFDYVLYMKNRVRTEQLDKLLAAEMIDSINFIYFGSMPEFPTMWSNVSPPQIDPVSLIYDNIDDNDYILFARAAHIRTSHPEIRVYWGGYMYVCIESRGDTDHDPVFRECMKRYKTKAVRTLYQGDLPEKIHHYMELPRSTNEDDTGENHVIEWFNVQN